MTSVRRVLLADDSEQSLQLLKAVISRVKGPDIQVQTASRGAEALALARQQPFDLVVADLVMDGPDGLAVLAAAWERNPSGRRILVTGYPSTRTDPSALDKAHVDLALAKPLDIAQANIVFFNAIHGSDAAFRDMRVDDARHVNLV